VIVSSLFWLGLALRGDAVHFPGGAGSAGAAGPSDIWDASVSGVAWVRAGAIAAEVSGAEVLTGAALPPATKPVTTAHTPATNKTVELPGSTATQSSPFRGLDVRNGTVRIERSTHPTRSSDKPCERPSDVPFHEDFQGVCLGPVAITPTLAGGHGRHTRPS
jgi:hypothetical protein